MPHQQPNGAPAHGSPGSENVGEDHEVRKDHEVREVGEDRAETGPMTSRKTRPEHTPEQAGARLDLLPSTYRTRGSGAARVLAALLVTVAVAMLLRSFPETQSRAMASTVASPERVSGRDDGVAGARDGAGLDNAARADLAHREDLVSWGDLVLARFDGASAPLHVVMLSPAQTATLTAGSSVTLRARAGDDRGALSAGADLIWEVTAGEGSAVVFRARGADVDIPAGVLAPGRYRVTVVARAGISRNVDSGTLDVVPTGGTERRGASGPR